MAGTTYHDPSGFGTWYVPEGKTPAQALADLAVTAHFTPTAGLVTQPDFTSAITVTPPIDGGPPEGPVDLPTVPGAPGGTPPTVALVFHSEEDIIIFWYDHPFATLADYLRLGAIKVLGSLGKLLDLLNKLKSGQIPRPGGLNPTPQTTAAINVSVNVGDSIASVIGDAISGGALAATHLISGMVGDITTSINNLTGGIKSWVSDVFDSLKGHFKDIADWVAGHAASIIEWLVKNIGNVIKDLAADIRTIVNDLANVIDKITTTINKINDQFITPIANLVNGIMKTITTLTAAIEGDLHSGLAGILQIPGDIAGAMTTLDATMQRTVEQLGASNKKTGQDIFLKYPNKPLSAHLEDMNNTLEVLTKGAKIETTFHDSVQLTDACKLPALIARIEKLIPKDSVIPDIARGLGDVLLNVISVVTLLHGEFEAAKECGAETIRREFPITKLSPGEALQALRRGFLTEEEATEELLVHGINKSRMNVLRDLGKQLLPVDALIDLWYRGIIDDKDRDQGMLDMAYTGKQISALMRASIRLIPPSTVLLLFQYGLINREALDAVLHENRYSDAEIQATIDSMYRPATGNEALDGLRNRKLLGQLNITGVWTDAQINDTIALLRGDIRSDGLPGYEDLAAYVRGSMTEGLDDTAIRARLYSIQNTLDVTTWINLFYRGVRTRRELTDVLLRHGIPVSLHEDLILAHRSLVPWRSIPRMLALGVISEAYAKEQLGAHGFDLTAIEAMLKLARSAQSKALSASSGELHAISVNNARHAFELGALTEQQYHDVLLAHGYDEASAKLAINVEQIQSHLHERRQLGIDLTNEVLGGLITIDDAMTQMRNHNFSVAESARVLKSIARTQKATVKTPPEPELRAMVKAKVIPLEDYTSALSLLGYAPKWVDAFVQWHFGGVSEPTTVPGTP